jgi:hypothetical protein
VKGNRLPLIVCLLFTAAGVFLLAAGETVVGLMCLLFFGFGAVVLALPLLNRRGGDAVRPTSFDGEPALLFAISRLKQGVIVVAAFGMAAAGVLIAVAGNPIVGGLGAVVFGGFGVIALVTLRGERGLILTPRRLVARYNGHAEMAWEDLTSVAVVQFSRAPILALDGHAVYKRGGWLARLNHRLLPVAIALPADNFVADPDDIVAIVAAYREDEARRALIGRPEEHARLR